MISGKFDKRFIPSLCIYGDNLNTDLLIVFAMRIQPPKCEVIKYGTADKMRRVCIFYILRTGKNISIIHAIHHTSMSVIIAIGALFLFST